MDLPKSWGQVADRLGNAARKTAGDIVSKIGTAAGPLIPEMGVSEAITDPTRAFWTASRGNLSNGPQQTTQRELYPAGYNFGSVAADGSDAIAQQQAAAQAAALAAARQNWMSNRDNVMGGITNTINQQTQGMNRDAQDYYLSARNQQNALNQKGMQNELARIQGRGGILARVGDQTKSAGVMLGQKNAGNSSAAQALANAYGTLGNRDVQKVEQGYAVNNEGINAEQQLFDEGRNIKTRRFEEDKLTNINAIVEQASRDLQALNDAAANASLPERIALENEKARIRSEATSRLGEFDSQVAAARGLKGSDTQTRRGEANRLNQTGGGASMFNLTPERDMQMQYQGETQAGGNLPIYQMPRKRY
jgi:hypothetical protein